MHPAPLTTDTLYVVSDLSDAHINGARTRHWRTTMVTNSIIAARKWAGADSIITEHPADEAWAIHATRVLPDAALSHQIAA